MKQLMKEIKIRKTYPLVSLLCCSFIIMWFSISCEEENYTPKPFGYLRVNLPDHAYQSLNDSCPYTFQYPIYAKVLSKNDSGTYCHKNIEYEGFDATLHLSYFKVEENVREYLDYSRNLAYQHQVKADAIVDSVFLMPENNIYGTVHYIEGNAASPFQFYVTDSVQHFLRGSLYFNATPNYDSIQVSLDHLLVDMKHQIETTRWK